VELVAASALAIIVIVGLGQIDVARIYLVERTKSATLAQSEADFALLYMITKLEQADRIDRVSSDNIRFRVPKPTTDQGSCTGCAAVPPPPCCFDIAANYVWKQFRFNNGGQIIRFYDPGRPTCTLAQTFGQVSGLAVQYANESPPPPGGEPPSGRNDSNMLQIETTWVDPETGSSRRFVGHVALRPGAYTNLSTGLQAPELGDLSPPPAGTCP